MKPRKHITVLSLGAGVQSTALALLLEREMLDGFEKPQAAIFSDTKSEPGHVYQTVEWLREKLSYPIHTVSWGDLGKNTWKALTGHPVPERGHHQPGYIDLPIFSQSGMAKRQCTSVYKIAPIKREIRRIAESAPPALTATQYLGISTNEKQRAKPAREAWLNNQYPLIEHGWTRADCNDWLRREYPETVIRRSACYFCPYRSKSDWREIRDFYPAMYQDALAMERQMQEHPRGPWFLRSGGLQKGMEQDTLQPTLMGLDEPHCNLQ